MSVDEIASYCGIMGCTVTFGDAETGFVHVDGSGIQSKYNNYRRFLAHNELSGITSPNAALEAASVFRIRTGDQTKEMTRDQFQETLDHFRRAIQG